ncbi:peptidylprolyl isomerase [Vallitalea guaymasensis]|uniref:Peptidylprolyl isomerase n=2 Tax=Vallitalea guaymasensis TaxID=1185412 RepID=A0A8J8MAS6_9FIRM|nr:peptidylprolyl isomerase [Vallitalea guaymasensis]QUH29534.1 peptidylprolyl isomerase [Vallitalea guaymasensis]
MKKVNKLISVCLVLAMATVMFAGCSKGKATEDKDTETKVVATINGEHNINLGEVNLRLRQIEAQYEGMFGPDVWDQQVEEGKTVVDIAKENAIFSAKSSNILALVAKEKGVEISDEDAKNNEKSAEEFLKKYEEQFGKEKMAEDEITLDVVKKLLEQQTLTGALFEQEMKDYEANEEELNTLLDQSPEYKGYQENGYDYYAKQVRVRHILLKTLDDANQPLPDDKKAEVKAKAEEVLAKVKAGEDFEALVKEYSEDPGSKDKGGEYTFGRGSNFAPEFTEASFGMEPGDVTELVETSFGYHIIKLEEIIEPTEEDIQALKDQEQKIKDSAIEQLKYQAFDAKYKEWEKDYTVEENEEVVKAIEVRQSRNAVEEDSTTDTDKSDETTTDDSSKDDATTDDTSKDDNSDDKTSEDNATTDDAEDTTTDNN